MDLFSNFGGFGESQTEKEKYNVDWEEFDKAIKLAKQYCRDKAKDIEGIIAVPNTGLILASILAKELDKEIFFEPQEGNFLVVDLIADKVYEDFLRQGNKGLSLYSLNNLEKYPDYFVFNLPENTEVIFPWEK